MTKELKEQLRIVAEYSGYKADGNREGSKRTRMVNGTHTIWLEEMNWHTSIDAIAPIAIKVMGDLNDLEKKSYTECVKATNITERIPIDERYYSAQLHSGIIRKSAATFDPLQIFNAVYAGIEILNAYKSEDK